MADPVNLPAVLWSECRFRNIRTRDTDRMEGRRTESQTSGTPYWVASYKTEWLNYRKMGIADSFSMSSGDDGEYFLGYDVFRPRPIRMDLGSPLAGTKAIGGAFDGTGTLNTITNSRTVVIYGLPAAFLLSDGDYVEFRMSTLLRSLHMIKGDATADGTGHVTLSIKPGLDLEHFTTSSVVNFEKPSCIMQIDPGSYDPTRSWESRQPSFSATEVFPFVA